MALFPREPLSASACALVGEQWSVMRGFDAFELLGPDNCATLDGPLLVVTGLGDVLATEDAWLGAWRLALTDVINAGAWILVVVVLEVEVRLLGAAHRLPRSVSVLLGLGKSLIYSVLALAAVYWWIDGDFLDFWDAALWLFAFVFIEMNVFEWQREIVQAQDESDASAAGRW